MTVAVEHDATAGKLRIVVTDNGVGIAAEELGQVFSLFVSHKGSRGTGLGLPVSQKIVREHGGEIIVTSEPGKGSRFALEIPAVMASETPRASVTTSAPPAFDVGE